MEVNEVITKFQEFVEKNCQAELFENVRLGKHVLIIDFQELCKFSPEVSEELLDKPEETLKAFELALRNFDLGENASEIKQITVRVKNLPKEQYILIRNIRSNHLGKFIWTEGVVRQKSDVRPQVTSARFECPSCGNIIPVLQLEKKFKEPSRCNCGRNGKFKMISKELVDAQGIVLEESTKDMEGGEQPKRINIFLKNDLVSPMSEKRTNPGNNIRVVGIIKEVPIILKTGGQSTKFDLLIEANCVEGVEEDYSNIEISKEDEERIKVLANDPQIYEKLTSSLAPGIFGHDKVKEALCMQFVGGVTKHREDGVKTRGDIHILLIGDPGCGKCVTGDTKIILDNGEIVTIEKFYEKPNGNNSYSNNNDNSYLNTINTKVCSINEKGLSETYMPVSVCRRKAPQKIIKIVTNTGNEIKVTKEHPLFTTNNGLIFAKEAKDYKKGEYIALPSRINANGELQSIADVKNKILKSNANNKVKYQVKKFFDADFARLMGYLLGDGYVKFRKTTGIISFANNDNDLLDDFERLMRSVFNVNVSKRKREGSYEYYTSSIELVRILHTIWPSITELSGEKGTSKIITTSPNYILKEFIKSLFDCEAHVRKDGRVIEFSSKSREMCYDLKYLLLRFGIISQLNSEMKCATNTKRKIKQKYYRLRISGEDVVKYHNHIGFTSKQKQKRLVNCINIDKSLITYKKLNTNIKIVPNIKELLIALRKKYGFSQFSFPIIRSTYQHYEKGDRFPSYDKLKELAVFYKNINKEDSLIEILSQISNADIFWDKIKSVQELGCKEEYVYDLEINNVHNFVANGVVVHNSQLLKRASVVAPKARYVSGKGVSLEYNEPLLIKENNKLNIVKIGEFVDKYSGDMENVFVPLTKKIKALSLNKDTKKLEWKFISNVFRHRTDDKLLKFHLESGREVTVTKDHSIYTIENGRIAVKQSHDLMTDDYVLIPKKIIIDDEKEIILNMKTNDEDVQENTTQQIDGEYARLLGYFIAEGHLHAKEKEYYKVEFTLGKKDVEIVKDLQNIVKNKFNKEISIKAHGENGLRLVINGKELYHTFVKLLGDVAHKHAKEKRIPLIVFNSNTEIQQEFIKAYINGDGGVTKSKELASDLLYLFLCDKKIASLTKKFCDNITVIRGRNIYNYGYVYELKSPKDGKQFDNRYERPPYKKFGDILSKHFFKNVKTNKSTRITIDTLSNTMLLNRFCSVAQEVVVNGNDLRKRFGESILEYIGEHNSLFNKQKVGRQIQVTITEEGNKLIDELIDFVSFMKSDVGFARIKKIEEVENKYKYVYDVSVPENENFVAGFGGIICHNSGAGLTAAVVKDEFLSGWSLEAGAMVLANKGILMVDELDKMSPEDRDAMHEGLEQQSVSISKANIQATLRCETTVLAAANPKLGRFDPYGTIAGQIDLPPTLISRFDLIFPIKDLPDEEKDTQMAKFILELHKMRNTEEPDIPTDLLRKYLVYAKQKMSPQLTDGAIEELREYYVQMRSSGAGEEKGIKTIPITARQLEGLVRLSEAYAKLRLGDKVTRKDAKKAKGMLEYCLQQVGMDPETGKIDIDRISTGVSTTERSRIVIVREIINELEETLGKNIPLQTVIDAAKEKGIEEDKTMELIEKMKRNGDLFEPKRGEIQKI